MPERVSRCGGLLENFSGRPSRTVGVQFERYALNRRKTANADGGPTAEDLEKSLKQLVAEQKLAGRQGRKSEPKGNFKE